MGDWHTLQVRNPHNCHTIQLPHSEWTEGSGIPWVGDWHTLQVLNPSNCHTIQLDYADGGVDDDNYVHDGS